MLCVYLYTAVCTTTDLVEVRVGLRFSHPIEVLYVNKLEVKGQARVGHLELRQLLDMRQVPQVFVTPVVQVTQTVRQKDTNTYCCYVLSVRKQYKTLRHCILCEICLCSARVTHLARARPCASRSMVGTPRRTNRVKRDCSMLEYF